MMMITRIANEVGVVAIGRNEGERLRQCLESAKRDVVAIVYVDSGSTDGSVEMAQSMGVDVVNLDLSRPFTAARARNEGIRRLMEKWPTVRFVQVVDGDCEIVEGWIDAAMRKMHTDQRIAVVCGRRRERHREASIYNRLCDMEWDTPIGEAKLCGGDALIRINAYSEVNGYNDAVIAGEEPEFCVRLRKRNWAVHRIDHEMTLHDARMSRFNQWWRRMVRSGHAYAEGRARHGGRPEYYAVHEVRSIVQWTVILPIVALAFAWATWGLSLLLFGGYVVLWNRIRRTRLQHGDSRRDAADYAFYCVLGKFAELTGAALFWWNRARGKRTGIIEYKTADDSETAAVASMGGPRS